MENILFWLDVEQYRHFDGPLEDMRGYAEVVPSQRTRPQHIQTYTQHTPGRCRPQPCWLILWRSGRRMVPCGTHGMDTLLQNIGRKYIQPNAELQVFLPGTMRTLLLQAIGEACRQPGTLPGLLDEAQAYVYDHTQRTILPAFFRSPFGMKYLV